MKFTKNEAIERIKGIFAKKAEGIDLERTITDVVSNGMDMLGENSEVELDAFVGFMEKNVSSALGFGKHLKKTATDSMQEQIAELQRKIGGKDTSQQQQQTTTIKSDDPAIQAMLDKLTVMEQKLNASEQERTIADKRNQLIAKMSESIKDKDWIEGYLKEISITAETDVEAKAKDYVAFYNKSFPTGGKITPRKTGEQDNTDAEVKKTLDAAKAIMQQRQGIIGQTVTTQEK